jgi:hypothetical protein
MEYTINPCKACLDKHKGTDLNINTINSCVVNTAAAFSGIGSNNAIRGTEAAVNWKECMEKVMASQGRTPCDFQIGMTPVFIQAPHYFPNYLMETKNPEKAKQSCIEKCSGLRFNRDQCIENCKTDRSAVQSYTVTPSKTFSNESYSDNNPDNNPDNIDTIAKEDPVPFWIAFIITTIVLIPILVAFYRILFLKRVRQ